MNAYKLLHPKVLRVAESLGYRRLLPIQEKAIPYIIHGRDTLVIAPTGSGKTEAALFPVLSMMLESGGSGLKAIYVTPMRSLNRDISWRISNLVEGVGFKLLLRHGDSTQAIRRTFLREPPDLMVTTPESLNMLLTIKDKRSIWRTVKWVIVDEVHELLESKRGTEFSVVLERLERASRHRIQRIGLSATLSRASIEEASNLIACCRRVDVVIDDSDKSYEVSVEVVWGEDFWEKAAERIADIIRRVDGSILVFTNTRSTAEKLASTLSRILHGVSIEVHHGSLSRTYREGAEKRFREGKTKVLVATSSMELGIDIGSIDLVIQFLSPRQVKVLLQRVGRAGHRLGGISRGVIVTIGNLYEVMESIVIASRAMRGDLEELKAPKWSMDALAHQLTAMALEGSIDSVEDALNIIQYTGPYKDLPMDKVEEVASHLESVGVLRVRGNSIRLGRRAMKYFYRVSMIPDEAQFKVVDIVSGDVVGSVGERFIEVSSLSQGDRFKFILGGRVWEAIEVDFESRRLDAKPLGDVEGTIPSWEGELIPVDYKVAREVCKLLNLGFFDEDAFSSILKSRGAPEDAIKYILEVLADTRRTWGIVPGPSEVVVEQAGDDVIVYTCLGSKGNFALALLISKLLENTVKVEMQHMPYAIVFSYMGGLSAELVRKALLDAARLDEYERIGMVQDSVRRSRTYLVRLIHVAKRMGVIDPDKSVPTETLRRLRDNIKGSIVDEEVIREIMYDKLDMDALNNLLNNLGSVVIVKGPSRLASEVLENPYIRRDVGTNIRALAIDQIIKAIKKRVSRKTVLLQCIKCGYTWKASALDASKKLLKCKRCGISMIAPLPDTEWGWETARIYQEYLNKGKARGEKAKRVREVKERAVLYLNYATQGMGERVIEALLTVGVGPQRAKKVLEAGMMGDKSFYRELLKAEEEYIAYKKYWKK